MREGVFTVLGNQALTETVFRLTLAGDTAAVRAPGQFVNIALPGFYLRRPFSLYDWDESSLTLLCRRVGAGTEALSRLEKGETLRVLTGLGNGFDAARGGPSPILVGGGVGAAPLFALSRELLRRGARPRVLLGFQSAGELLCAEELAALGAEVAVATADGSAGRTGLVTALLEGLDYSFCYACGPLPMLRALDALVTGGGQYSLEARMGCGFGACMGCTIETKDGPRRVCADGPVFEREALGW